MFNQAYLNQVGLLLRVLPLLHEHDCFALKGGTAMNLFVQDLPRLSVDIDLAYLPLVPRNQALPEEHQGDGEGNQNKGCRSLLRGAGMHEQVDPSGIPKEQGHQWRGWYVSVRAGQSSKGGNRAEQSIDKDERGVIEDFGGDRKNDGKPPGEHDAKGKRNNDEVGQ